ncbi:serine/threonine-kinase pkn1 domain protein, partial [Chlamydia psittaci 84-8471/1]
RTIEGNQ